MAETPKYFDIEDTETGKKYRIETTDPAATYDEAVEYFSTLPEDQWTQYEYRPKTATQPKTAPVRTASVAMENVPEPAVDPLTPIELNSGSTEVLTREKVGRPEISAAFTQLFRSGVRDLDEINKTLSGQFGTTITVTPEQLAHARNYDAYWKARGVEQSSLINFAQETGKKDPEAPDNVGEQFLQASKRSLANMANSLTGTVALGADLVGADETADALLEEYITKNAQIAFEYGTPIDTGEVDSLGDAGMFAADTFGELAPQIASSLGLGWAGKAAAEYGVKKGVQEYVEDQVQSGVAREVAEQQAAALISKRGLQGAAAGTTASSVAQETGATFGDTFQQTGEKAPMSSLVAGVVSGSLDSVLPMTVLKKFGGDALANQFKREFIRRAGKEGAKGFLIEGGTEAMQEFITSLPKSVVTGESPFTEENFNQMFEAFVRGGLGGSGVNVAVEGVNSVRMATRDAPAQEPTGEPIVVPSGKKNTKAYRQQVAEAQDRVIEHVNSLTKGWTNTPDIEVYDNFTKLEGIDNGAIGVYTEKTLEDGSKVPVIKINTEAVLDRAKKRDLSPESVVEAVTFHEALGHHGLTSLFREDLDAFLDDIYTNGSEEFRNTVDTWLRKNPGSYAKYNADSRRILATEEVMAEWSEKGPLPRTLYDKIANLIKDFGRQMGMNLKYTTREVRAYLAVANERTMSGTKRNATPSVARNMPWHGSPHSFASTENNPLGEFDHSKMGSGEGRQVFGWGTYLTDSKQIAADNYRDRLVRDRGVTLYGEQLSGDPRELKELLYSNFASPISSATYSLNLPEYEGSQTITSWLSDLLTSGGGSEKGGKVSRQDFGDLYDDWGEAYGPGGWSEKNRDEFIKTMEPVREAVNKAVSLEKGKGSLYYVELPENSKWLEWEVSLDEQPELKTFLENKGIQILDETSYKQLVKKNAGLSALLDPFSKSSQALYNANPVEYQAKVQEYREVSDTLDNSLSLASLGRDVYDVLSRAEGPEGASKSLFSAGFTGNRYLADNLGQKKTRKNDGSDVFNYVVFDDKTPKIVNKYMAGDGPIEPDDLTADDLIEAENALDILNRLDYTPTVISPDQLEAEALSRNLPPSDITRLVGMEPGKLMKRLFLYDIAATKLSDRAAKIKADIDKNGLTPEKQLAYIETTFKLSELTAKIFNFQGEIGRTLAANRRVNFSRKRVKDLKAILEQYGAEALALADPETFMKYMAEIEAKSQKKDGKAQFGTGFAQYINIPRAIMSSADLSAPLRQGIVFVSYPEYWKSFVKMFSMLGPSGERNYKFLMEQIATHPDYELMQKARVAFSSLDGELTQREEDFQTELARKIPVFGKVVKASEQAYAGFLNKLRADMFNRFVADYRKANIEPDEETLKGIGRFINAGTGRAELPEFLRPSSTVINATFFSGRLMYSRVQMLNPVFYAQLPKGLRVQAARSMLGFAGIAGLVAMSLNALWPEEIEVEVDPRSSDFMKIKVGNTRFDIGGGFNQYIVLGARTGSWLYNNTLGFVDRQLGTEVSEYEISNKITAGGDERKFGNDEYGQETFGGAIGQFFRTKLSPQASYVVDAMVGEDVIGREFTLEGSLASRLVPMTVGSVYESYKQDSPVPLPVIFTASLFGVGTNTYTAPGMDPKKELEAPVAFDMKDLADGENDMIRVEAGTVTLKKAARDKWEATLNNYYPLFVEEVAAEMGLKFEEMDDTMKKATVKEATKRARENAKKDMMYELGLK